MYVYDYTRYTNLIEGKMDESSHHAIFDSNYNIL